MHSRQHQYNKSQWKKDYRRQYQEILTITMFVSTELREMKTQRPHCTYTLMQWLATFQQSLSGPAWQTLAEEMCSCCTALLAACFPIIPGWWESCTSCGGGCMTKTSVRGRSWPLRLLLYQSKGSSLLLKEAHTQHTKNTKRFSLPQLALAGTFR